MLSLYDLQLPINIAKLKNLIGSGRIQFSILQFYNQENGNCNGFGFSWCQINWQKQQPALGYSYYVKVKLE